MNSNLIDKHLIDLLRIPAEQRSLGDIAEAVSQIGAAADLGFAPLDQLHHELNKLFAIVEFLATELAMKGYDVSLSLREPGSYSSPLFVYMRNGPDDVKLIGSGRTAEEVLRDLRCVEAKKDAA